MSQIVQSILTLLRIPYCLLWFFIGLVAAIFLQASTLAVISCGILAFGLTFELVINLLKNLGIEFTRLAQSGLTAYTIQALFGPTAFIFYGCGLLFWAYTLSGTHTILAFIAGLTLIIIALIRAQLRNNRAGHNSRYSSSAYSHGLDYVHSNSSTGFSWGSFGGGDGGNCNDHDSGYSVGDSGGDSCDF